MEDWALSEVGGDVCRVMVWVEGIVFVDESDEETENKNGRRAGEGPELIIIGLTGGKASGRRLVGKGTRWPPPAKPASFIGTCFGARGRPGPWG